MLKLFIVERVIFLNPIQRFLSALNDRIQEVSAQVIDINEQKNAGLEIENIFFANQIDKNNIIGTELLKISEPDFKRIMQLIDAPEPESKLDQFKEIVKIVKLYQEVNNAYGKVDDASQYQDAIAWLDGMAQIINHYFMSLVDDNSEQIRELKDSIATYKRYQAMFRGDELTEPIFNMVEFNNLLIICRMNIEDTTRIKKMIGQANIGLVVHDQVLEQADVSLLDKYRLILSKKQKIYEADILLVEKLAKQQGIVFTLAEIEKQIDDLSETIPEKPFKNVQNAVVCILLTEQLNGFNEFLQTEYSPEEKANQIINIMDNAEKLLVISRRHSANKIEIKKSESEALTEKVSKILETEKALLDEINPDDYGRYTQLLTVMDNSGESESVESEKYRLAMVVESLRQALKTFMVVAQQYADKPEMYANNYKEQVNSIFEYLEVYELLKTRQGTQKEKTKYRVLYLTDGYNKGLIIDSLTNLPESYWVEVKRMLAEIGKGKFKITPQKSELNDYHLYNAYRKNTALSYMLVGDDLLLAITASRYADNQYETNKLIANYRTQIDNVIMRSKTVEESSLLWDEQANIRDSLTRLFSEKSKKVK